MQIPCLFVLLRNTVSFPNIDGLLQQNHLDSSGKRYYLGIWVFVSYWFICLQRICTTMHFLKLRNKLVWLSLPFLKVGCIQGDPTRLSQVICFWWGQKFQKTFRTEKSNNKVTALRVSPQSMIPKTVKISLWSEETQIFDNVHCRQQTANPYTPINPNPLANIWAISGICAARNCCIWQWQHIKNAKDWH